MYVCVKKIKKSILKTSTNIIITYANEKSVVPKQVGHTNANLLKRNIKPKMVKGNTRNKKN